MLPAVFLCAGQYAPQNEGQLANLQVLRKKIAKIEGLTCKRKNVYNLKKLKYAIIFDD